MSRIVESLYRVSGIELNEARNPENEAFNRIIRGALRTGKISNRGAQYLTRLGYTVDDNNETVIAPNGAWITIDFDDYDTDRYGNYVDYYYVSLYDKNDNEVGSYTNKDVDYQNLLNSYDNKIEDEDSTKDDISDFAVAKKKYNNEKSKLNDLYSNTKDAQLDTIQYRRSNPNQIHHREEKDLEYQRRRVQKAKEEKDAILKKHGINPRESYSASKHSNNR